MNDTQPNIVVIGGGTGSIAVLQGLRDRARVMAVVAMADDGGSNGVLRDELGLLPASDVWKCMTALSDSPQIAELFRYRFSEGTFTGHTLGNMLMAAAGKTTGSFEKAVALASEILRIKGTVIPATLDDVRLQMQWPKVYKSLVGEHIIDTAHFTDDPRESTLSLLPEATANPAAVEAIKQADIIVIAPGDLYTSLGQQLVIEGIRNSIREASGVKMYIANLVTKPGHTDGFSVADHAAEIERFVGSEFLDYVLYNQRQPSEGLQQQYDEAGAKMVEINPDQLAGQHYKSIACDFLGEVVERDPAEKLSDAARSLIRHDPTRVADAIINVYADIKHD